MGRARGTRSPSSMGSASLRLNHPAVPPLNLEEPPDSSSRAMLLGAKKRRGHGTAPGDKSGKGLRHFSMKVCEKVESKGHTTYNEVADELVSEFTTPGVVFVSPDQQQYDEKNIRRRVYDALNVLMALDIITKEKKEIQWKGLPSTNAIDSKQLKAENFQLKERIEKKAAYLEDLEGQIARLKNLIQRNERRYNGTGATPAGGGVALPFILVQTQPQATVELEISEDMQVVHFDFNSTPFELHDDAFVLKSMSYGEEQQQSETMEAVGCIESKFCVDPIFEEDSSPVSSLYQSSTSSHSPKVIDTNPSTTTSIDDALIDDALIDDALIDDASIDDLFAYFIDL